MKYEELKIARAICGIRQEDLANLIGQAQSNYAAKENGQVAFSLEEGLKIHKEINKVLISKGRPTLTMEDLFFRS